MTESKVWLVTGSSSGFGRSMTELLLKNGNRVVATLCRKEALSDLSEQHPSSQLLIIKMDVVNHSEVAAAFAKAKEAFGRVDVVFNNAGTAIGEMESMSDQDARQIFEVNFWGASNVTREAIRMFREVNKPIGGRLLQVSSGLGLRGRAAASYYAASKHALEGFSESIAQELDPAWNIQVTIIEPGPFRTKMFKDNIQLVPQHPAYADPELPGSKLRHFMTSTLADGDTEKAVVVIEKLTHLDEPPLRFPLHKLAVRAGIEKARPPSVAAKAQQKGTAAMTLLAIAVENASKNLSEPLVLGAPPISDFARAVAVISEATYMSDDDKLDMTQLFVKNKDEATAFLYLKGDNLKANWVQRKLAGIHTMHIK